LRNFGAPGNRRGCADWRASIRFAFRVLEVLVPAGREDIRKEEAGGPPRWSSSRKLAALALLQHKLGARARIPKSLESSSKSRRTSRSIRSWKNRGGAAPGWIASRAALGERPLGPRWARPAPPAVQLCTCAGRAVPFSKRKARISAGAPAGGGGKTRWKLVRLLGHRPPGLGDGPKNRSSSAGVR